MSTAPLPPLQPEEPGVLDTQKVWTTIDRLTTIHVQAIRDLNAAVLRGDEVESKKAYDTILWVQEEQQKAHRNAEQYQLQKTRARLA